MVALAAALAVAVFFTAHLVERRFVVLLWADAVGLGLFAVLGAEAALRAGASPWVAVLMGVVTATFGGVLRDIVCAEVPLILRREIYATAAALGAAAFVLLHERRGRPRRRDLRRRPARLRCAVGGDAHRLVAAVLSRTARRATTPTGDEPIDAGHPADAGRRGCSTRWATRWRRSCRRARSGADHLPALGHRAGGVGRCGSRSRPMPGPRCAGCWCRRARWTSAWRRRC